MAEPKYLEKLTNFVGRNFPKGERARAVSFYSDINRRFAGHVGELVLAIERKEEELMRSDPFGGVVSHVKWTVVVEDYCIGIVQEPTLCLKGTGYENGRLVVPTGGYLTFGGNFRIAPVHCEGGIGSSSFGSFMVDLAGGRTVYSASAPDFLPAAELFAGDDAVTRWFIRRGESERGSMIPHRRHERMFMLWRISRLLSHPLPLFSAVDRSVEQWRCLLEESRKLREEMSARRGELEDVFGKELAELAMDMGSPKK